jgi:uncharacterized coiled-coil protein SlyX
VYDHQWLGGGSCPLCKAEQRIKELEQGVESKDREIEALEDRLAEAEEAADD